MKTEISELSLNEMENINGGNPWAVAAAIAGFAWAITGLYEWGYAIADRAYERAEATK